MPIIKRHADLSEYPSHRDNAAYNHLILGNIDGNTLKLIYMLLRENIIHLDKTDYERLFQLYHHKIPLHDIPHTHKSYKAFFQKKSKAKKIPDKRLQEFLGIIQKIKVINRPDLHLLGSELVGHGYNDFLTFKLIEHLDNQNLPFDIILSNNDSEFVRLFEDCYHLDELADLWPDSASSFNNLVALIKNKQLSIGDIHDLVQTSYYPHLKLIDYTVSPESNHITILTHAPCGFETIKAIATQYNLPFSAHSIASISNSIDAINDFFHAEILLSRFSKQYDTTPLDTYDKTSPLSIKDPILRMLWNVALGDECQHDAQGDYTVDFIHSLIDDKYLGHQEKDNIHSLIEEKETHKHLRVCENAFHYKISQLEDPPAELYMSDYTRFITLEKSINQLIQPKEKNEHNSVIITLIKTCQMALLANLSKPALCDYFVTIMEDTLALLNNPTKDNIDAFQRSILAFAHDDTFTYAQQIGLIMIKLTTKIRQSSSSNKSSFLHQAPDKAHKLAHSMTVFSSPLKRIAQPSKTPLERKKSKRKDRHVHFNSSVTIVSPSFRR